MLDALPRTVVRHLPTVPRLRAVEEHWYGWKAATLLAAVALVVPWSVALATSTNGIFGLGAADLNIYLDATRRLLDGDGWYLARQLHGPYDIVYGDVLYPPMLAWLLAPFLVVPVIFWWLIPLAIVAGTIWRWNPRPWTWSLMLLCLLPPLTFQQLIQGNPVMWVLAVEVLALSRGWPATFVLFKPSLVPFALLGIHRRSWWIALAVLGALSLPVLDATLAYPMVIADSRGGGLLYSIRDVPLMLLPIFAWLGRRERGDIGAAVTDPA